MKLVIEFSKGRRMTPAGAGSVMPGLPPGAIPRALSRGEGERDNHGSTCFLTASVFALTSPKPQSVDERQRCFHTFPRHWQTYSRGCREDGGRQRVCGIVLSHRELDVNHRNPAIVLYMERDVEVSRTS